MNEEELGRLVEWIKKTDRPELTGVASLPQGLHERPAFGPNIPVIGWRMQESPSGLILPHQPEKWPIDLFAQYVTADIVLGRTLALDQIQQDLQHTGRLTAAIAVSHLICLAEQRGLDPELKKQFAEVCFPPEATRRVAAALQPKDVGFTSPQVGLAALKLIFQHGSDKESECSWDFIGALLLAVGDHMVKDREGAPDEREQLGLEVARYSMFYREVNVHRIFARYRRIWSDIAPAMKASPNYIDVLDEYEKATGLALTDAQALALWAHIVFSARGEIPDHHSILPIEHVATATTVDAASILAWIRDNARDADWFAANLSSEAFAWDFRIFLLRPLLNIVDKMLVCISDRFLLEKTTSGVLHTVLNALPHRADKERWLRFFGDLWEAYVRSILHPAIGPDRLVDENVLKANGWPKDRKNADNIALYPDYWLLVESVARRMDLRTTATGGPAALEADLDKAVLKKARQLSDTVRVLNLAPEVTGLGLSHYPSRFLCMIALPGPFPMTPDVWEQVQRLVTSDPYCSYLTSAGVEPLMILDADDLELALAVCEASGASLVDLLEAWLLSPLKTVNLTYWLKEHRASFLTSPTWVRRAWDMTMPPVVSKIRSDPSLLLSEVMKVKRSTNKSRSEKKGS